MSYQVFSVAHITLITCVTYSISQICPYVYSHMSWHLMCMCIHISHFCKVSSQEKTLLFIPPATLCCVMQCAVGSSVPV